jgi:DNA-binding transcriptional MocR family regulator
MLSKNLKQEKISFSWGYPDLLDFPLENYKKEISSLKKKDLNKYLQYHPGQGLENLRNEIVKQKMGDFGNVKSNEIIITPGATFGIFLLAYFLKNNLGLNKIGVFLPCYDTALEIFKIVDLEVVPLLLDKFDSKVQCLYLMPRFANPSGESFGKKTMSVVKKYIQNGSYVIEDDVYHTFQYKRNSYKSIKSQYPSKVFYLDSFSKILAPGLRLGYIASTSKHTKDLVFLQKFICSSASTINQEIAFRLLKDKNYEKIIADARLHYEQKMRLAISSLIKAGLDKYFIEPEGGYYIWLKTKKPYGGKTKESLYDAGVNLVSGDIYFTTKSHENYVRLSIANINKNEIRRSVQLIKQFLYE